MSSVLFWNLHTVIYWLKALKPKGDLHPENKITLLDQCYGFTLKQGLYTNLKQRRRPPHNVTRHFKHQQNDGLFPFRLFNCDLLRNPNKIAFLVDCIFLEDWTSWTSDWASQLDGPTVAVLVKQKSLTDSIPSLLTTQKRTVRAQAISWYRTLPLAMHK